MILFGVKKILIRFMMYFGVEKGGLSCFVFGNYFKGDMWFFRRYNFFDFKNDLKWVIV